MNLGDLRNLSIPKPSIEIQRIIVDELESQMVVINGISILKTEAQKKINQILADVWGVEFVEPIKMEVEDEQEN